MPPEVTLLEIPPCQTPMCGVAYSCSYVLLPTCKTTFARLTQSRAISQSFRVFITFRSMRDTTFFHFSKHFFVQNYRFLYHGDIYNPDRGQGHDRPFQTSPRMARGRFSARGPYATGLEWPIMPRPRSGL